MGNYREVGGTNRAYSGRQGCYMQHLMLYKLCHLMQFNPLGEGPGRSTVPFGEMEEKHL